MKDRSHGIVPEQQQQSTREGLKVVVLVNVSLVTQFDVPKDLSEKRENKSMDRISTSAGTGSPVGRFDSLTCMPMMA